MSYFRWIVTLRPAAAIVKALVLDGDVSLTGRSAANVNEDSATQCVRTALLRRSAWSRAFLRVFMACANGAFAFDHGC
jgi:hypothetical protein